MLLFEVGEDFNESLETLLGFIQHKNVKVSTTTEFKLIHLIYHFIGPVIWRHRGSRSCGKLWHQEDQDWRIRRAHAQERLKYESRVQKSSL